MCYGHYADTGWTPQSRPGLDVKTDDIPRTPKRYEGIMKLSVESSVGFLSCQKMTWEKGKDWFGFLCRAKVRGPARGVNLPLATRREHQGFLSACPDMGQNTKGGGWRLKAIDSQTSKNGVRPYYHMGHHWTIQNGIPFVLEPFIDLPDTVLCRVVQESRSGLFCLKGCGTLLTLHVSIWQMLELPLISLGGTTCAPQGTRENARPLRSYREVVSCSLLCLSWEVLMRQFLITSWALMTCEAFHPAPLRLELQDMKLLSWSLELAPQPQGLPQLVLQASDPCGVSAARFGVWDKDDWELAPEAYSSFPCLWKESAAQMLTCLASLLAWPWALPCLVHMWAWQPVL